MGSVSPRDVTASRSRSNPRMSRRVDQPVLAAEAAVDAHRRHAGLGGHGPHCHRGGTVADQHNLGGVDQGLFDHRAGRTGSNLARSRRHGDVSVGQLS